MTGYGYGNWDLDSFYTFIVAFACVLVFYFAIFKHKKLDSKVKFVILGIVYLILVLIIRR